MLTVNQFFTAGRVVARSDLLTVLPEGFAEAAGFGRELVTCELPLALAPVHVEMIWHLRHDADPAHRWLREQMRAAVTWTSPEAQASVAACRNPEKPCNGRGNGGQR